MLHYGVTLDTQLHRSRRHHVGHRRRDADACAVPAVGRMCNAVRDNPGAPSSSAAAPSGAFHRIRGRQNIRGLAGGLHDRYGSSQRPSLQRSSTC
jgi:hypothetical protein